MSKLLIFLALLTLGCPLVSSLPSLVSRQAPNTAYAKDPLSQTASLNATYFVIPIPKTEAVRLAKGRRLLAPQGLPPGWLKEDEHPFVITAGLFHDIRQATLKIPNLSFAQGQVPFVDGSGDGQSPFTFNVVAYQSELVPVAVGTIGQGTSIVLGNFDPPNAASKSLNDNGEQAFGVDVGIENQLLGLPTPNSPVFSAVWKEQRSQVDPQFFKGVAEAPYIHTFIGTCTKIAYDFDQSFADPYTVKASSLQTYPPTTGSFHDYTDVPGFHVTLVWSDPAGPGSSCSSVQMIAAAQSVRYA